MPKSIQGYVDTGNAMGLLVENRALGEDLRRIGTEAGVDSYLGSFNYVKRVVRQVEVNVYRRNLGYLAFSRYVTTKIKPGCKGRLGARMKDKLRSKLETLLSQADGSLRTMLKPEEMIDEMTEWSRLGKHLDTMCAAFGIGCLFYLGEQLSQDL